MKKRTAALFVSNPNANKSKQEIVFKKNISFAPISFRRCPINIVPAFECLRRRLVVIMLLLFNIAQANYISREHRTMPLKSGPLPTFADIELSNHTARVGNEVSFGCTVKNLGNYKVAWLHADKGTLAVHPVVITQNERLSVRTDSRNTYILTIKDIRESDAGKYICQINTGPPQISISGHINVVVPPNIVDEASSADTLATEGMRVTLSCHAEGNPTPIITWRREDRGEIKICAEDDSFSGTSNTFNVNGGRAFPRSGCRTVPEYTGNNLELRQITRYESGTYLCIARNTIQPAVSKRVTLYVDFPPTLWITHQRVNVDIGGSVNIDCLTAAHPPSINYWSREGQKGYISSQSHPGKYKMEEEKSGPAFYNKLMKLQIYNITHEDLGTYKCLAKNSQGETSGEIELYEAIKPSTTTSSFVDPSYDYPIKEIEINTIEDCIGESCLGNKVGREEVSGNGNPYGEDERHNNEIGLWKNGKKRKGRRKNGRKNRKNRKRGNTNSDLNDEYGKERNDLSNFDKHDSSSSFHRDTSYINSAITNSPRTNWSSLVLNLVQWLLILGLKR